MPIVPRAKKQVSINALPDMRQDERAPGAHGLAMLADAQQEFGNTIKREALNFGQIAIKKQEEIDRIELGRIKAERDANLLTIINDEERNPDYEGMSDRIYKRVNEYDSKMQQNVNGRIRKYVDNMIKYNNAALTPKIQEIYLKNRTTVCSLMPLVQANSLKITAIMRAQWQYGTELRA